MAAPTTAQAPKAPTAPTSTETPKPPKAPKVQLQSVFPTAEEAVKEANNRTKGPRRAFSCKAPDGSVFHVVANNEGRAGGICFAQIGGEVAEIGKVKKAKTLGVDSIMQAINLLPEDQRKAITEQLKALKK